MKPKPLSPDDIEMRPDAWKRFERAVKKAAKSPPVHKPARKPRKAGAKS